MESKGTIESTEPRSKETATQVEEREQSEFDRVQEQILSAAVEKILKVARTMKDPFDRRALLLALEEIGGEEEETVTASKKKGDPSLVIVKRWLEQRTYSEKLTTVLVLQLLGKEHVFRGADRNIGGQISRKFEESVVETAASPDYLRKAPPDEVLVSNIVNMMLVFEA